MTTIHTGNAMVEQGEGGWNLPERRFFDEGRPDGPERRGRDLRLVHTSDTPETVPPEDIGAPLVGVPNDQHDKPDIPVFGPIGPEYLAPPEYSGKLIAHEDIGTVRRIVAVVYQRYGYVKPEEIKHGFIVSSVDPHVADSTYYGRKREGVIRATARLLAKEKLTDFPAIRDFDVDPTQFEALDPDITHYREVSALAKTPKEGRRRDVLDVYASMMKDSVNADVRYWLMSVDVTQAHKLKQLFGARSFKQLAAPKVVMGSETVPLVMDIHKALRLFGKRFIPKEIKAIFQDGLQGLDSTQLDTKTKSIVARQGVLGEEAQHAERHKDHLRTLAYVGLGAYAVGRAGVIPILALDEEGVNTYAFGILDVVTVWPYVKGVEIALTKANSRNKKIGGAVMGGLSFMAPYTYMAYETGVSEKFWQAMGVYAVTLAGMRGVKKAWTARKERKARQAEAAPKTQSGYAHETTW